MTVDPRLIPDPAGTLIKNGLKLFWLGLGFILMLLGAVGALLPTHLGGLLLVVGLVMVLRNSRGARKTFIRAQRRHPRAIYPIRRLLRRDAPVVAVIWHQMLRTERFLLRRRRFMPRLRRSVSNRFRGR